jgi:hypothetical protein
MNKEKTISQNCLKLIFEKKYSEAKALARELNSNNNIQIIKGIKMALEGIINSQNNKSNSYLFDNLDKLKKLRQMCKLRSSSTWADDFDKGYFETWLKYISLFLKQHSNEK